MSRININFNLEIQRILKDIATAGVSGAFNLFKSVQNTLRVFDEEFSGVKFEMRKFYFRSYKSLIRD